MPTRKLSLLPDDIAEDWALIRRRDPKVYVGRRTKNGKCVVKVNEGSNTRTLPHCRNLRNHSRGFEWGYGGSGPAQLSLAILADFLKDDEKALRYYQKFKFMMIGGLPQEGWALPESVVKAAVDLIEGEEKAGEKAAPHPQE